MKVAKRALGALFGTIILALPISAPAQTSTYKIEELKPGVGEVEPRSDGFLHRASGYVFPLALGAVPARKTTTYGPGDADVYYTLYGGGNNDGWISLYVYPATIGLREEAANVEQSIVEGTSGRRIATRPVMGRAAAAVAEGWFEGSVQDSPLMTGYRVARVGDWFIKARISIPAGADEPTFQRIGEALNAIEFAPTILAPGKAAEAKEPTA